MFNIIYSEFIKLKKSYILIIAIIGGGLMPVMEFIKAMEGCYYDKMPQRIIKIYVDTIEVMSFQFVYILLFSLIAGYVFSREFTDKTANNLYAYPISRIKIFFGKLITIYIIILFVYVIQILFTYITMYIIWGQFPTADFVLKEVKVNIYSSLLQLIIIPIPILISNITKNIIFPVIYGLIGTISSVFMMVSGIYMQGSPLILPALPLYYIYSRDPIDFILAPTSAVLILSLFGSLCIYHYTKMEIK